MNEKMYEKKEKRFQNNLRWMLGLRDCVKWIQETEQKQGFFYDLVIRLRDDTLIFDKWLFDKVNFKNALTSAEIGSYRGINDHNLVIDRKWLDIMFRGLIEDYYFNKTNRFVKWNNTEHRIYQLAIDYNIPIKTLSLCEQPLIPLRSTYNNTHWIIHPQYAQQYLEVCMNGEENWRGCSCGENFVWLRMFQTALAPIIWS